MGKLFDFIPFETSPPLESFDEVFTYTDPCYKRGEYPHEFKATIVVGKKSDQYFIISQTLEKEEVGWLSER